MAQQTRIPPFPNSRNGDDVNYTECFSIAREERLAGMTTVDPKDSNQNPKTNPPPPPPTTKTKAKTEGHLPDPQQYKDKLDDGSSRQRSSKASSRGGPSPLHPAHESKPTRKDGANPPAERHPTHNSHHRRPSKESSRDPPPLHPTHGPKSPSGDGTNPFAERAPSDGRGSRTPGRSRRKHAGGQSYEPKEDHFAIPPLADIDENNAANITEVFKKAQADLSSASPNVHAMPTYQTTKHHKSSQKSCSCCEVM